MIYKNNKTINEWYFNDAELIKVYKNGAICYYKMVLGETPSQEPCFAVVDDITQYSDTEFVDVFDKATEKWYKLNNLDQYEQYGVYGSGRTITYYEGKLTIDNGYEYEWDGSEWSSLGEVSGSTATLPDVPFTVNINAKNYNASTKTFAKTNGQLANTDIVISEGTPVLHDGYVTVSSGSKGTISGYGTYFTRDNNNPTLTIISKQSTVGSYCHIFANRDSNYNWMYRAYNNKLSLHGGNGEVGDLAVTTQPVIESVRVNSSRTAIFNNYTDNTSISVSNFNYGSSNTTAYLFYGGYSGEYFVGDFYWLYMSQTTLTDEQVQQVITYNEGDVISEYPKYYAEKDEPENNVVFEDMEEALAYECPWVGMRATIDGELYIFDSNNEWSKVPYYYRVEDVTTSAQGGSGWTISGSSTYNPDLDYYDDYSVYQESSTSQYKVAKVTIFGYDNFTYYLRSSGYSSYNYVVATNLDEVQTDPTTMNYNDSRAITNTYNFNKAPASVVNLSNYRRITYNNLDKTVEHTFYVIFYGRYRNSVYGTATLLIPKDQTQENWEQVTFSASTNVGGTQKNLYIDGNNSTSGGTNIFFYRWMIGLPSGSHTSYTNYSNYSYCPSVTSSTFTSVAGGVRQVDYVYTNTTTKNLQFRLVDGSGNTITTGDTVYYNMTMGNGCGASTSYSNATFPSTRAVTVGGSFVFTNSSNRHYIYGYTPNIQFNTSYYSDNYNTYFDIPYTKLDTEAVTVTYTTYDPNDTEIPAFSTKITYPYNGGTTSSITLTSYDVPYTYPYVVSQTNTMFSADSQSFTAGQSSRTVTFTLYPNNRDFSTVADLEAYQYAWEGMVAYVDDTRYKYENGEWVEITLPYDAEIEYLESDGSDNGQYINTGLYLNTSNFEVGYETLSERLYWGYTSQGSGGGTWLGIEGTTVFFGNFGNRFTATTINSSNNVIKYASQSGVTANGTSYSRSFSLGSNSIANTPLYIFGRYDFRNRVVDTNAVAKLKSFYLKNNGELVLDMIPVRVDQVGYMYDKVSGQLFGNDGTGSFILGNDVQ